MKIVNTSWGFIFTDAVLPVQYNPFKWVVRLGEDMGPETRRLAVKFVWFQVASVRWMLLQISSRLHFRF